MTSHPTTVLGVDPGGSGGLAVVSAGGGAWAIKMPATERDVWRAILELIETYRVGHAVVEKVHAMPAQGVSSTFKFAQSLGMLRAFLVAADVPFESVAPGVWQRSLGCLTGGNKNVSKAKAQELFPHVSKITHATADALLIAEYGVRQIEGRRALA